MPRPTSELPAIRVVIVDENRDFAEALARFLADHRDLEVVGVAATGGEGVACVRELAPDVVVLDQGLPDADGFEVAARLSRLDEAPAIVMVSAHGGTGYRDAARAVGAAFVDKGSSGREVLAAVMNQARARVANPAPLGVVAHLRPPRELPLQIVSPASAPVDDVGFEDLVRIIETIDAVVWLTDADRTQTYYVSPAYQGLWGRTCASLYADTGTWYAGVHPHDRARVRIASAGRSDPDHDLEYRVLRADGSTRWVHERVRSIPGPHGEVARLATTVWDVTCRHQLLQRIHDARSADGVGRLAGGLAHDLNNLLAAIQIHASAAALECTLSADTRDALGQVTVAVERAAMLVRQLLELGTRHARPVGPGAVEVDVGASVRRAVGLFGRMLGRDIVVVTEIAAGVPLVQAGEDAIERIVTNLVINARDAMPSGGTLRIGVERVHGEQSGAPGPMRGVTSWVRLTVADDGHGIAGTNMARIFEPFFTTKAPGQGTGLGLAAVQELVQELGGWIEVASHTELGTVFSVYLPPSQLARG